MSCGKLDCTLPLIPWGKYCELHRKKAKKCIEPGCIRNARDRYNHCKRHNGGDRCIEPGCKSSAVDKYEKCKKHFGGKRCIAEGCTTSARGKSDHCVLHGGYRCVEPGCTKSMQGKSDRCISHNGGNRCTVTGCKSSSRFKNGKCRTHGGGVRCPNCIDWIDSRGGDSKYDGYCATCFKRVFPEDPRSTVIYKHSKEIRVRNAITETSQQNPLFAGFVHDRPLYTGNCDCTHRRRVDHRKLIGNTMIAVETDEYAHRSYDEKDEEIRYDDLYMIHSGKWIFIRFNPDNTKDNKTDLEDRISVLLDVMEEQMERVTREENQELVEIIKLFY
jgi:hypothetical protein